MFLPGVAIALLVFGSGTTRAIGIGLRCWQPPLGDDGGNAFDCSLAVAPGHLYWIEGAAARTGAVR
jgi:hypothetical protein